jgi:hypothetical protein
LFVVKDPKFPLARTTEQPPYSAEMKLETVPFLSRQLRIDFLDFTIAQPDVSGNCIDDYLEITGSTFPVHKICGENSDQHGKRVAVSISSLTMNCCLIPQ